MTDKFTFLSFVVGATAIVISFIFYYLGSVALENVATKMQENDEILLRYITEDPEKQIATNEQGKQITTTKSFPESEITVLDNVTTAVMRANQSR
jgi:F0F1-type ATP synthase membrane subunit a